MGPPKDFFGFIPDPRRPRYPEALKYSVSGCLFAAITMYLSRLGARRQIGLRLNTEACAQLFQTLFGDKKIAHGDTLNDLFAQLDVARVEETLFLFAETLIDRKVLYPFRLLDTYYPLALDGTGVVHFKEPHCPHCLTKTRNGVTTYYHNVLAASIVTPAGLVIPVALEFIENADCDPSLPEEKRKQDCELKAFYRLAPRLRERFPRLNLALLMDGLYASGPVFEICQCYGWKYLITLSDDQLRTVNEEFHALAKMNPENALQIEVGAQKPIAQQFSWANGIAYRDSRKLDHTLSVMQCLETKPGDDRPTCFRWVTNCGVDAQNVHKLANNGGRWRWKTENELFNVQKNGGYALEHVYTKNENSAKIFLLMLQFAFILEQLIERGSLYQNAFPKGLGSRKNLAATILEAIRRVRLTAETFAQWLQQKFQIRFPDKPKPNTLADKIYIPASGFP